MRKPKCVEFFFFFFQSCGKPKTQKKGGKAYIYVLSIYAISEYGHFSPSCVSVLLLVITLMPTCESLNWSIGSGGRWSFSKMIWFDEIGYLILSPKTIYLFFFLFSHHVLYNERAFTVFFRTLASFLKSKKLRVCFCGACGGWNKRGWEKSYISMKSIVIYSYFPKNISPSTFLQREFRQNFFKKAFLDGDLEKFLALNFFFSDTMYDICYNIQLFNLIA